ncbi:hypothetical protein N7541_011466 [Penicillium brevicompactum]|uniref:Uncharacterized protein n=1 Tax=Penicillium brevicompactum TaxID=5074 RepID=A0A9W9QQH8_PENBR|nr:uncharacterized protein N7506_008812 [Penicillium brevicompactum]KAJ5325710.1 hypothetical protein N7506_008812 [Penicillium brevicompactum]KAJ5339512.1 hypothetical protein N7452_006240 [Penicillium brevicompactum]KAJ5342342.1 hypothetical protein N7541_011466 [Penicillium brevicompactum]
MAEVTSLVPKEWSIARPVAMAAATPARLHRSAVWDIAVGLQPPDRRAAWFTMAELARAAVFVSWEKL